MPANFVAYPSQPPTIGATIETAVQTLRDNHNHAELTTWRENDIPGRFVVDPILAKIEASEFVVGDITALYFNVVFEIGLEFGTGKRVNVIKNSTLREED